LNWFSVIWLIFVFLLFAFIIKNENSKDIVKEQILKFLKLERDPKKRFRIQAKKFFLAYFELPDLPGIFDLVRKCLNLKFQNTSAKNIKYIFCKEPCKEGGINLYCFLEFSEQKIITNPRKLNLVLKSAVKNSKRKKYVEYRGHYYSCFNKRGCIRHLKLRFLFNKYDLFSNF